VNVRFDVLTPERGVVILLLTEPFPYFHLLPDALVHARTWWSFVVYSLGWVATSIGGLLVLAFKDQVVAWIKKKLGASTAPTS
jgi:hypothetical protein